MQRKALRARVGSTDRDIPIGTFTSGQFLTYDGTQITTAVPASGGGGAVSALPFRVGAFMGANPGARVTDWLAYRTWIGQSDLPVIDFGPRASWSDIEDPGAILVEWGAWQASYPEQTLIFALPMLPDGLPTSDYATGAAGGFDSHYTAFANTCLTRGLKNVIFRLGWEFNLSTVPSTADFVTYWQRIVDAMRAVFNGTTIRSFYCWNPNIGGSINLTNCWPGAAYVDYIGVDCYDQYGSGYVSGVQPTLAQWHDAWRGFLDGNGSTFGLQWFANFARDQGVPLCIPEWGVWGLGGGNPAGGDNPSFIQHMIDFCRASGVVFACYYDYSDGTALHRLWPGASGSYVSLYPNAKAKYLELF